MTDGDKTRGDGLRYVVALIEIQGGLVGLWGFLRDLAATAFKMPLALVPGVAFIGLVFVASVVAGVALWNGRRSGYLLSVPVQLAQLIWFVASALTLRVSASGWLLADAFVRSARDGSVAVGWQFDAARKAGYALSLAPREETTVAINLVALAILAWLIVRIRRRPARSA